MLSKTIPKAMAIPNSPFDVSSAIVVVMTRLTCRILPPTIITAPTSEIARPKHAKAIVTRAIRASKTSVLTRCQRLMPSEMNRLFNQGSRTPVTEGV